MIATKRTKFRKAGLQAAVWVFLWGNSGEVSLAQETPVAASLTATQIVERMVAKNQLREGELISYEGTRQYHLEYHGMGKNKVADVVVKMTYYSPDRKEFTMVSETGSKMLRDRVLKRLLEGEVEATQEENRKTTAINTRNYEFRLADHERTSDREFYVLDATPKVNNKFLLRGRIWVDAQDFAIARIEGQPAKNPSWWTTRNDFVHTYRKLDDFWLPVHNETVTKLRLFFGHSLLTISYNDYKITATRNMALTAASGNAVVASQPNAPASVESAPQSSVPHSPADRPPMWDSSGPNHSRAAFASISEP